MPTVESTNSIIAIAFISLIAFFLRRRLRSKRVAIAAARWPCSDFEGKPQNRFKRVLSDNSHSPFSHLKREGRETSSNPHPYHDEISDLVNNPPVLLSFLGSRRFLEMGDSYVWVETEEHLESLARQLSREQAIAVDTEQHSLRSFLGFTALIQISTRDEDFLVDAIALHDVMSILRPVFADPSICKVFHGADNDVLWLQRDFHLYIVNMFDTAKACEVLSKPHKSLAYLLETYCGVATNKTLQREDWRTRPLSPEMVEYARADAHYLLYIADCLISELQILTHDTSASPDDKFNFFFEASRRSNMVCLQLFTKERETSPGAFAAASLYSRSFNQGGAPEKCSEAKDQIWKLCAWRDMMARIHDESLRYILSDQAIVALAAKTTETAKDIHDIILEADLTNCYSSVLSPSPVVSTHADELSCLLQEAIGNTDNIFRRYLQKHLGHAGCSPLSIYNYSLLSEFKLNKPGALFLKQNGGNSLATSGKKASRDLFVQKFSCKSPVYHNCRIYANDGRLLCFCDRRKLEWYLRRDLAKIVENDPPAIMLLFEPKGRPEDEDNDFYIQSKKNICVGCGEKDHYLRYRIIPSCYRMHFPEHLKSHRSHDIVLLCVDCHEIAHSAAEKYKRQIAVEFGIPLFVQKIVDSGENDAVNVGTNPEDTARESGVSPLQLRTAAMALLRHGSSMPSKRHDELTQIVKTYFGGRDIFLEDLERALLVGMSPHERRRLEKKRGLTFKHHNDSVATKISKYSALKKNTDNGINSTMINMPQGDGSVKVVVAVQSDTSSKGELFLSEEICVMDSSKGISNGETLEQANHHLLDNFDEDSDPSAEIGETCHPSGSHQVVASKIAKKVSLLGHGPHGKQVVEYLLNNYGEDGILHFCQRWRQVFVEAIHPHFLPAGWDIMHSGRREFGDYSVYNPAKMPLPTEG